MTPIRYYAHPLSTLAPRDLLLLEALPVRPTDAVLEVGIGSGSSLLRFAGAVAVLHGLDVSEGPVARLRHVLASTRGPARDIQLFAVDFCGPDAAERLPRRYDLIFTCDTIEHVPQPAAFFANLHAALAPGGRLFATFPNESPDRAHGITFFERRDDVRALLEAAGFPADSVTIQTLRMNRAAERIMNVAWGLPRAVAKKLLRLVRGKRTSAPQTFDETDFFTTADRLEPLAPVINAYCWSVLRLMSLARPVYPVETAPEVVWDTRLLIQAQRGPDPSPQPTRENPALLGVNMNSDPSRIAPRQ